MYFLQWWRNSSIFSSRLREGRRDFLSREFSCLKAVRKKRRRNCLEVANAFSLSNHWMLHENMSRSVVGWKREKKAWIWSARISLILFRVFGEKTIKWGVNQEMVVMKIWWRRKRAENKRGRERERELEEETRLKQDSQKKSQFLFFLLIRRFGMKELLVLLDFGIKEEEQEIRGKYSFWRKNYWMLFLLLKLLLVTGEPGSFDVLQTRGRLGE